MIRAQVREHQVIDGWKRSSSSQLLVDLIPAASKERAVRKSAESGWPSNERCTDVNKSLYLAIRQGHRFLIKFDRTRSHFSREGIFHSGTHV
jgi:hypothetical protein